MQVIEFIKNYYDKDLFGFKYTEEQLFTKINNEYFGRVKMFITSGDDAFENTILENKMNKKISIIIVNDFNDI